MSNKQTNAATIRGDGNRFGTSSNEEMMGAFKPNTNLLGTALPPQLLMPTFDPAYMNYATMMHPAGLPAGPHFGNSALLDKVANFHREKQIHELQTEVSMKMKQQTNLEQQLATSNNLNRSLKDQVTQLREKVAAMEKLTKRVAELESKCVGLNKYLSMEIKPVSFSEEASVPLMEDLVVMSLCNLEEYSANVDKKKRGADAIDGALRTKDGKARKLGLDTTPLSESMRRASDMSGFGPSDLLRGHSDNEGLHSKKRTHIDEAMYLKFAGEGQMRTGSGIHPALAGNPCNCKKSRCLKFYCECFSQNIFCKDCNCSGCENIPGSLARADAINAILRKRPDAFLSKSDTKEITVKTEKERTLVSGKGCNCKKSHCLKKYCDCFQMRACCGPKCRCVECHNVPGNDTCPNYDKLADNDSHSNDESPNPRSNSSNPAAVSTLESV